MGPIVVVSQRLGGIGEQERRLEGNGAVVRAAALWTTEEIALNAADASLVILGAVEPFDAAALARLPRIQAVVRRGVGVDNVDLEAATRLGIVVANVPDASVEEVSEHALALLLAIERAVPWLDRAVHDGLWLRDPARIQPIRAASRRMSLLTLGVIGLGRIGQAMVRKSRGIYGRVIGSDPLVPPSVATGLGIELVGPDELLERGDHISVHAPLTPATRHLIDADALARARPGAVLVNTSRGGLVDERALIAAVGSGRLRGAGLDVTEHEPLAPDDPLLAAERILLTAHSAHWSTASNVDLAARSVDAAIALVQGRRPDSVVNPDVLRSASLRHRALAVS